MKVIEFAGRLLQYAKKNPIGFTVRISGTTFTPVTTGGWAVAYAETQNSFGLTDLVTKVIPHAIKHEGLIGGWKDDDKYYFDSVQLIEDTDLAIKTAIENNQKGIFNLDTFEERLAVNNWQPS